MSRDIVLIVHNIRSTFNVGAILRTCDGLAIKKVYFTGYTPYPRTTDDPRLPHIAAKLEKQINKSALGAEKSVTWEHQDKPELIIKYLKNNGYEIVALEQNPKSINLTDYKPVSKIALILGEEVDGVNHNLIKLCDKIVEIPMQGKKESFNVSVACAIALFSLRFGK